MTQMQEPPQPEAQFIISALQEELSAANNNRLYLVATLKQLAARFEEAQAFWLLERESLIKSAAPGE